ncbi:MAG: primosomal protein N' [Leptospirales bacterium]|nr:primosomal protein N' [Leptospirales bacterium]
MFELYADLWFRRPIQQAYTYRVPSGFPELQPGWRVRAPLRGQEEEAAIVALHRNAPPGRIAELSELCDEYPVFTTEQMELARWMAEHYLAAPGECLLRMAPAARRYRPRLDAPSRPAPEFSLPLTEEQEAALRAISADLDLSLQGQAPHCKVHLLHGVTGAGKTEIYMRLIARCLAADRGAILLVPEISLTVQLILRLRATFEQELALLHSALGAKERFTAYVDALYGRKRIALGARSAVFAPVHRPLLFIVDEEHDSSFKERQSPRYDARQIALQRAGQNGGLVLLGSATPRVESAYFARALGASAGFQYHRMSRRATGASLPKVELVDAPPPDIPLSGALIHAIHQNLQRGEQTLVLLNRRGYHPFVYCRSCKDTLRCPNCSVSLTLHRGQRLLCHYCGYASAYSGICPTCNGSLQTLGSGTQRLEERLLELFPEARLQRLDQDAVGRRRVIQEVIAELLEGRLDILVGTQMIAKGLDAPGLTLVGVLQADFGLAMTDFRAAERTFALLTQVAGRAGRAQRPGRVIFECLNREHPLLQAAAHQDYETFYRGEVQLRKEAGYPPFVRLLRLVARAEDAERAEGLLAGVAAALQSDRDWNEASDRLLGPAPAPLERLQGDHRWHLIIKTTEASRLRSIARRHLLDRALDSAVRLEIDFDPADLL